MVVQPALANRDGAGFYERAEGFWRCQRIVARRVMRVNASREPQQAAMLRGEGTRALRDLDGFTDDDDALRTLGPCTIDDGGAILVERRIREVRVGVNKRYHETSTAAGAAVR